MYRQIEQTRYTEIVTPFLDSNNDSISINYYIVEGNIHLTDGVETISNLDFNGVDINSPKRKNILESLIKGFGVSLKNNKEIYVQANYQNFACKKTYAYSSYYVN